MASEKEKKKVRRHKNEKANVFEPPMTNPKPAAIKVTHKNALFTIMYRQHDRRSNYKGKHRPHVGVKGTVSAELFDGANVETSHQIRC